MNRRIAVKGLNGFGTPGQSANRSFSVVTSRDCEIVSLPSPRPERTDTFPADGAAEETEMKPAGASKEAIKKNWLTDSMFGRVLLWDQIKL
jgi:hypothetical protein